MDKEYLIREAEKVKQIVDTGILIVDGIELDIKSRLNQFESKEYRQKDIEEIDLSKYEKSISPCKYKVLSCGSDNLAYQDYCKDRKICVLNFASSKNPGGGFIRGCMAQEEALCQASNLYYILREHSDFYEYNRNHLCKGLYTDGIIFTKDCLFFRDVYRNLKPVNVDVITCAAPNFGVARRNGVSKEEIECTMSRRIEQIFKVAIANNVKVLALGAFGCGVFRNNPDTVASIMYNMLKVKGYEDYFEEVLFPMNGTSGKNVDAFLKTFYDL